LDVYDKLPPKAKEVIGDPYLMCLQHVVIEVSAHAKMFLDEDPKEKIAYVFERNPSWTAKLLDMWNRMVGAGQDKLYRMGTITFGEKKEFIPLQVADRLAFESYKHFVEKERRPVFNRLIDRPQHFGRYFNQEGMDLFVAELKRSGKL
jgi:hypothetical protein